MSTRVPYKVQHHALLAVNASIVEAQAIEKEIDILQHEIAAFEDGGPEPDRLARAVANVLLKEYIGFPTDGTFTIERNGQLEDVEYPITYAGLTNVLNELVPGDKLGFRPGPNGAYETAARRVKEEIAILAASQALGEPVSQYAN